VSLPPHSFRFPTGRHCPLDRAIVFNSSLTWRQALPKALHHHPSLVLRREQVEGIARLARALKNLEPTKPRSRHWGPAWWHVFQWWDPAFKDWNSGRRALITPRCHTPQEAIQLLEASPLRAVLRGGAIEVLIPRRPSRQSDS